LKKKEDFSFEKHMLLRKIISLIEVIVSKLTTFETVIKKSMIKNIKKLRNSRIKKLKKKQQKKEQCQ
jgi:hypothetical protein